MASRICNRQPTTANETQTCIRGHLWKRQPQGLYWARLEFALYVPLLEESGRFDLSHADLSHVDLGQADLSRSVLTYRCWRGVKQIKWQDALSVRPHDTFKFELEVLIRARKGQQRILLRAATKLDFDYWLAQLIAWKLAKRGTEAFIELGFDSEGIKDERQLPAYESLYGAAVWM